VSNTEETVNALKAVNLSDTPFGPEKLDSYGNQGNGAWPDPKW
jgi:hypothetical protein